VIRKFDTPHDLMSLPESIVVNCTGLGSKALFMTMNSSAQKK